MNRSLSYKRSAALAIATAITLGSTSLLADQDRERAERHARDFGLQVENLLIAQSQQLFGVEKPLEASADATTAPYRSVGQPAPAQVLRAYGLEVEYLTRDAANLTDMMAFYPAVHPTHLITCVEGGRQLLGNGKFNPAIQRIDLASGQVETILRGMSRCDGIRTTAWGTVLATEETGDGGAYEILDPLNVTEQTVLDRAAGLVTDPAHVAKRPALPTMAWEGLAVLASGVVIAGDELRPGSAAPDVDGGAIFKFVPDAPRDALAGAITDLNQSPLQAGDVYAMQVSCVGGGQQFGQGCEIGNAAWIPVSAASARADADANGATGYYRPEDLHRDDDYNDPENPEAVRFCWANTGNEGAQNYAEVICGVDHAPTIADPSEPTVAVNRFVEGDLEFNSFDNLAFQPRTGNLYVIEDHRNGDIFGCLPDGIDRDIKTDGCMRILSVKDSSAEPTGFLFSPDGRTAYVSIQHSNDALMPLVDGHPTDDVLKITGFKLHGSSKFDNEFKFRNSR